MARLPGRKDARLREGGAVMRGMTALLLILVLAGCAAPLEEEAAAASRGSAPAVQAAAPQAEAEDGDLRASMVEASARPLLEEEILAAYDRAVRVYSWFDLAPLSSSGEGVTVDGRVYHRVNMEGVEDLEDLRAYLRGVFSQELTDRLLDGKTARIQYREIDGYLYVSGNRRDRDAAVGGVEVEAEQLDEANYCVNVRVDLLDEGGENVVALENWSFPYTLADGRWVFTDFCLVY